LEAANLELANKVREMQQKTEVAMLEYELELENNQSTLEFFENSYYGRPFPPPPGGSSRGKGILT